MKHTFIVNERGLIPRWLRRAGIRDGVAAGDKVVDDLQYGADGRWSGSAAVYAPDGLMKKSAVPFPPRREPADEGAAKAPE